MSETAKLRKALDRALRHIVGPPTRNADVEAAHAQFGGDLVEMLRQYERPDVVEEIRAALTPAKLRF